MNLIQQLEAEQIAKLTAKRKIPDFRAGDTLRVGVRVVEGDRTRVQNFEGVCIARSNKSIGSSFTVRKISFGELTGDFPCKATVQEGSWPKQQVIGTMLGFLPNDFRIQLRGCIASSTSMAFEEGNFRVAVLRAPEMDSHNPTSQYLSVDRISSLQKDEHANSQQTLRRKAHV